MARCARCNKFMLIAPKSSFCKDCELLNAQDKAREEKKLREETEKRLREEAECRRKAEEARKEEEENLRKAEETRIAEEKRRRAAEEARKAEEERQHKAEEARKAEEERQRKAEEERKTEEERQRKAEEARKAEEKRQRKAEEARKAEEERQRKAEEARKAEEERQRKAEEARKSEENRCQKAEENGKAVEGRKKQEEPQKAAELQNSDATNNKKQQPKAENSPKGEKAKKTSHPNHQYKVGNTLFFGKYPQDSTDRTPVKWHIIKIEGDTALILADKVLDAHETNDTKGIDITWENCDLRKWMNSTMLDTLLSREEKNVIIPSRIPNGDKNGKSQLPTSDRLFLLDSKEFKKLKQTLKTADATLHAQENGYMPGYEGKKDNSFLIDRFGDGHSYWWLRTKGNQEVCMLCVDNKGELAFDGGLGIGYNLGIRPAMYIDLSLLEVLSGHDEYSQAAKQDKEQEANLRRQQAEEKRKAEELARQKEKEEKKEKERQEAQQKSKVDQEKQELKDLSQNLMISLTRENFKPGNVIPFGAFPQETDEGTPLYWQVLTTEKNKALVISKSVIKTTWYDEEPWTDYIRTRWTCWSHSSIHTWLNEEFLQTAFSDEQRKAISSTYIPAEQSRFSTMNPGQSCDDYVFLLSIDEAKKYFKDDASRICIATYEGQFHREDDDERIREIDDRKASAWWLRNQGAAMCTSAFVNDDGCILDLGLDADKYVLGVRPALWLDIDLAVALSSNDSSKVEEETKRLGQENTRRKNDQIASQSMTADKQERIQERKKHLLVGKKDETFGGYSVGDEIQFGQYQQYSFSDDKQSIDWIILDIYQGKALLISKDILDYYAFVSEYGGTEDWQHCSLRQWLNHEFLNTAFSEKEQRTILTIPNDDWERCIFEDTSLKSVVRTSVDQISEDKVFLLSIAEACETDLLHPKLLGCLQDATVTSYAESKNEFSMHMPIHGWWLRTGGDFITHATYAFCSTHTPYNSEYGEYGEEEFFGPGLKSFKMGIRPAIWIDTHAFEKPLWHDDGSDFADIEIEHSRVNQKVETVKQERVMINSFFTKLAGVTYNNEGTNTDSRQRIIHELSQRGLLDPGQELELRPDPQNRFDHQAVAVYGPDGRQIGFLPKEVAHRIFYKLQSTGGYTAIVTTVTGGDAGFAYGINVRIEEYEVTEKRVAKSYTAEDAEDDYEKAMISFRLKNFEEALPLLQRAADFGYPEAQYRLGTCFDYGYGTDIDSEKASYWYLKAAEQGDADAQADLGYNYREGIGVAIDYQKAVYWIQKAVAQNHANAMVFLGSMYEKGIGVRQDDEESFELHKQAAELGDIDGANNTGIALLIGRGVERDPYEAAKWNKIAAENGHKSAQFNLSRQYLNGDGVPQDMQQAIYWMRKAAESGHPQAIAILQQAGEM